MTAGGECVRRSVCVHVCVCVCVRCFYPLPPALTLAPCQQQSQSNY